MSTLSLSGATLCYKFDESRVDRYVKNQTALKFARNHANSFVRYEAVGSQMQWPRFWTTLSMMLSFEMSFCCFLTRM